MCWMRGELKHTPPRPTAAPPGSCSDSRRRIKCQWALSAGSSELRDWIVRLGAGAAQRLCPLWNSRKHLLLVSLLSWGHRNSSCPGLETEGGQGGWVVGLGSEPPQGWEGCFVAGSVSARLCTQCWPNLWTSAYGPRCEQGEGPLEPRQECLPKPT